MQQRDRAGARVFLKALIREDLDNMDGTDKTTSINRRKSVCHLWYDTDEGNIKNKHQ